MEMRSRWNATVVVLVWGSREADSEKESRWFIGKLAPESCSEGTGTGTPGRRKSNRYINELFFNAGAHSPWSTVGVVCKNFSSKGQFISSLKAAWHTWAILCDLSNLVGLSGDHGLSPPNSPLLLTLPNVHLSITLPWPSKGFNKYMKTGMSKWTHLVYEFIIILFLYNGGDSKRCLVTSLGSIVAAGPGPST